ncbi:DUF4241 domain-containing protein [Actinoplanes sp. L3-i22]|uniref:DUF4241 domain-containing protein n=1 Tax=Actinoplanes sp. L3-i22 TaxID=2836373 RepID=UPI001C747B1E|nr:DUF4241 domain-containing protein [Actinoplanes sp. L3-i22]BCY11698.1 hypothetical protein L3i22_067860 [Actinoplanes sp. L3-i22]
MSYSPDFTALLTSGGRVVRDGVEYVIEDRVVGIVTAPSGQIVGCDPLTDAHEAPPFTATVPPGRYELHAWVATIHQGFSEPDVRTVALQLVAGEQPAVRWEPALTDGRSPAGLGADGFFGYPVDAGVGTLADVVAVRALADWDFDRLDDVYIPAQVPPAPAPIDAITDEATEANVIVVSSGWGDGVYPTFVGRAADGQVTVFVTDFMVIPEAAAGDPARAE